MENKNIKKKKIKSILWYNNEIEKKNVIVSDRHSTSNNKMYISNGFFFPFMYILINFFSITVGGLFSFLEKFIFIL